MFLILSDTHGKETHSEDRLLQHADVAIHCGDLTEESKLEEYQASIRILKDIRAPLKLVIAGTHNFTMDIPAFRKKVADARPPLDPDLVRQVYGDYGDARQIVKGARDAGVIFLDGGSHQFVLENGALLPVYASPWLSSLGDWGFQYPPGQGHSFVITKGVDLVGRLESRTVETLGAQDVVRSHVLAGCKPQPLALSKAWASCCLMSQQVSYPKHRPLRKLRSLYEGCQEME